MFARNTINTIQLRPAEHSVALENTAAQHSKRNTEKKTHTTKLYTQHSTRSTIPDDIRKPKQQPVTKTFRHLVKCNKNTLYELLLLETLMLNQKMEADDVNLQINIFNNTFTKCVDKSAPFVTKEITRPFSPWFKEGLRQVIKKRDDMRNKLKATDLTLTYNNNTLMKRRL